MQSLVIILKHDMQHVLFGTAQLRDCCNIMHAGVQFVQSNRDIYDDLCKYKAQLVSSHCVCVINADLLRNESA